MAPKKKVAPGAAAKKKTATQSATANKVEEQPKAAVAPEIPIP